MKNKSVIAASIVAVVGGVSIYGWLAVNEDSPDMGSSNVSGAPTPPVPLKSLPNPAASKPKAGRPALPVITYDTYQSRYGKLPASLAGTQIPTHLEIDAEGHLIPSMAVRDLFDYFLSTYGEEDISTIIARVRELIENLMQEPARSETLDIFKQYLLMKQAVIEQEQRLGEQLSASGVPLDMRERFYALQQVKRQYLAPAVYDVFFAEQDAVDLRALDGMDIMQDASLTAEEKQEKLRALDANLPEEERAAKEQQYAQELLQQRVKEARQQGATKEEIFQLRAQTLGVEAAQRYAEAEEIEQVWDKRVEEYRTARASILRSESLSDQDKKREIEALRERQFDENERLRIDVIDKMMDEGVKLE